MVKSLNIKGLELTFVFRHKWDGATKRCLGHEFRTYFIGPWFKRIKVVGKKGFCDPRKWGSSLVNEYWFGITLFVCKFWITINCGAMSFSSTKVKYGDYVQINDRFESVHIWSEELEKKCGKKWTPEKITKDYYEHQKNYIDKSRII